MEAFKLMAGGAIFGVIAGCWTSLKSGIWRVFNLFLQDVQVTDKQTVQAIVGYLVAHYQKVGLYDKVYNSTTDYIRSEKRSGLIAFEHFGHQSIFFRKGWRIIYFQATSVQPTTGNNNINTSQVCCYFIFLRGTFNIDRIIGDAIKEANEVLWATQTAQQSLRKRFFVKYLPDVSKDEGQKESPQYVNNWQYQKSYRLLDRQPEDIGIGTNRNINMLDRLFFPDEILELIEEIKVWKKSRDIYQQMGINWKRGWLFHGPGGTGKTALASAFAHDLDMPIFVYNLNELSNREFMSEWKKMLAHVPCIALIEDIDNTFHGRKNISRGDDFSFGRIYSQVNKVSNNAKSGDKAEGPENDEVSRRFGFAISFDVLLNCLDGVDRCEGLFTIITTNHIEHIDPALGRPTEDNSDFVSTRPGRIDKAIELGYMLPYVKEKMARHILGMFPDELELLLEEIRTTHKIETPAQFQERCGQIGLKKFWKMEAEKKRMEETLERDKRTLEEILSRQDATPTEVGYNPNKPAHTNGHLVVAAK